MQFAGYMEFSASVQHRLIRGDGSIQDFAPHTRVIRKSISWMRNLWEHLRRHVKFFAAMTFATFVMWCECCPQEAMKLWRITAGLPMVGIVTSAGINYLATTFVSNSNPLINFNYHTYGTGDVHGSTSSPTAATAATPIVVTQSAHPFFLNDIIKLSGITGITGINGIWEISPVTTNTYTLLGSVGGGSSFGGGTNAAQLLNGQADTALTTEVSSITRVAGTQSNPTSNQYKSIATVVFTGTTPPLTIIEWGILSASSSGTLWDRRWMNTANAPASTPSSSSGLTAAPITITQTTDSIQTTYTLSCTAGGT
jgi:hypothetical protein